MSDPIDEAIQQAIKRGEFDNLKNKGKPLRLAEYFDTPEELRMAYALLKNADVLPPEVELLKEIESLRARLGTAPPEQATQLRKNILDYQLKYNLLMDARKRQL